MPTKVYTVKAMVFPEVMYGCESCTIKLSTKELMLLNCGVQKTLENPLDCKEIQPVHPKGDQSWVFIGKVMLKLKLQYLATWWEELMHWERPWCWGRLKAGGEGDDRGWDGWMASPTWCTWVWVNSKSWWWTGKPGVLQSMESQSDTTQRLNWTDLNWDGMCASPGDSEGQGSLVCCSPWAHKVLDTTEWLNRS